ncbi:MAG: class I SAM-dependent methyltransferase [Candidatus Jordarchaeales archaeon]|nr:class I SAM-dependent methyltransferase [Candidatus Jordarchaeia archaeon]
MSEIIEFEEALRRSLEPLKSLGNYEAWFSWFKNAERRAETYVAKMRVFLRSVSGLRVLDVGCGVGGACLTLANHANQVVGIEINSLAIQLAKLNAKKAKNGVIDFILASGLNLPFKEGCFNLTICNDVLEHVEDKHKLLKEIHSVLDDEGRLFLTTPNRLYPVEPHTGIIGLTLLPRKIANKIASMMLKVNAELPSLVTYKQLAKLLTENGFAHIINHPYWLLYEDAPAIKFITRITRLRVVTWFLALLSPLFTALCKKIKSNYKSGTQLNHSSPTKTGGLARRIIGIKVAFGSTSTASTNSIFSSWCPT